MGRFIPDDRNCKGGKGPDCSLDDPCDPCDRDELPVCIGYLSDWGAWGCRREGVMWCDVVWCDMMWCGLGMGLWTVSDVFL